LTVATTARSSTLLLPHTPQRIPLFAFFTLALAASVSLALSPQKRRKQFAALIFLLMAIQFAAVLEGCNGGSAGPPPPPPPQGRTPSGTYTITVTGMSGVAQRTVQFTLVVQ
jgi:hypothetical protein